MTKITFSDKEKEILVGKIKAYFSEELSQEIAQFDAEFLLDFIADELGPYFYNRGLYDAQTILESKTESIIEAFYEIEKPTNFDRR